MSDLTNKTCKELREIAKELGITGRWDMNKQELIDAIENVSSYGDSDITFETECVATKKEGAKKAKKTPCDYLNNVEPGTLVAFKKKKTGAVISAKFVSIEDGEIIVETKMGSIYRLAQSDIIWVKTGARWPKWVFNLFNAGKEVDIDNAVSKVKEQNT